MIFNINKTVETTLINTQLYSDAEKESIMRRVLSTDAARKALAAAMIESIRISLSRQSFARKFFGLVKIPDEVSTHEGDKNDF